MYLSTLKPEPSQYGSQMSIGNINRRIIEFEKIDKRFAPRLEKWRPGVCKNAL
jgi:hypothetical protein